MLSDILRGEEEFGTQAAGFHAMATVDPLRKGVSSN